MTPAAPPIYLDHNATTPLLPEVVEAMLPFLREHFGNPSSGHAYGRAARAGLEAARAQVAALLGASAPEEVVFTSGGTEASNLAIRGVTEALGERRHVVTTTIEHPASAGPCAWLERHGWRVSRVGPDAQGRVPAAGVAALLAPDTALVTLIHAHNETGVLQPVADVARHARERGVLVHADAAQSVGKLALDVQALGVDLLSLAGHKLYGPRGVGALYVRRGTPLAPLLRGAGQEGGVRPGTENVAAIVGLGVACERARRDLDALARRQRALAERLLGALRAHVPGLALAGAEAERLPNTLYVRFPGVRGSALLAATPEVAAGTGSACHDGHEAPPAVLLAMGVPADEALGAVRLTLGRATDEAQVDVAALALARAWARLHRPGATPPLPGLDAAHPAVRK